jgi:hypothetical protein
MRIFGKIAMLVGSLLIIVGVILGILAFAFGGRFYHSDIVTGDRIDVDTSYEDVTSIVIDYRAGSLEIKEGDSFRIVAKNVPENQFKSSVENGVWTITDKKNTVWSFLNNINLDETQTVTIYIPESVLLEDFDLEIGAGKVSVDLLDAKQLKVSVGAGEVVLTDITAEDMILNCGVGSIQMNGEISHDSMVECGVGDINLLLTGDADAYDYDINVGLGSTRINGETFSGVADKQITHESSVGTFTLDCGVGEIDLAFTADK